MNQNQPTLLPATVITPGSHVMHVMGTELHFGATAQSTGDGCTQWLNIAPPQVGIPMHVHDNEDELFLILDGEVRFEIDGREPFVAGRGTSVFGPRGVAHAWATHGDKPSHMLVTALQGGVEAMFQELSKLPSPPNLDFPAIVEICGRHGIRFL